MGICYSREDCKKNKISSQSTSVIEEGGATEGVSQAYVELDHHIEKHQEKRGVREMLLHGRLIVKVHSAEGLPDTDCLLFNIAAGDLTDPFVVGQIGPAKLFKTRVVNNDLNPTWNEAFVIDLCHDLSLDNDDDKGENEVETSHLLFKVRDKEHISSEFVAWASIPCENLMDGSEIFEHWIDLHGKPIAIENEDVIAKLCVSAKFVDKRTLLLERSQTQTDEIDGELNNLKRDKYEVPNVYFGVERGSRVTLYQDADTPKLDIFNGLTCGVEGVDEYIPTRAWRDISTALEEAKSFIFITGWSVFTDITLIRDTDEADGVETLGDLLKRKANDDGVDVVLLIWDERLSSQNAVGFGMEEGLMSTHDELTYSYFEGSSVKCRKVCRTKKAGLRGEGAAFAAEFVSACYTHHQKTIICDVPTDDGESRELVAFVGGLDLTDGRYDDPTFPLWPTNIKSRHLCSEQTHEEEDESPAPIKSIDFYSRCICGSDQVPSVETGPRQPWHDCHAQIRGGHSAWNVLKNFVDRCEKETSTEEGEVSLITFNPFEYKDMFRFDEETEESKSRWRTQIFRSITSDSCMFRTDDSEDSTSTDGFVSYPKLHSKFGRKVDNSINKAMVHIIRNARRFVYIENQYFLGSAYAWSEDKNTRSMHTIPREITQRILDSIDEGILDFRVYIVIPMYPEGDPSSAASQEILYWQFRTIDSMYKRITQHLKVKSDGGAFEGLDPTPHPKDFLNFYCLAKRESAFDPSSCYSDPDSMSEGCLKEVCKNRRHPIYVHSKLCIVDDEYVLVGSANINQRSLSGTRDTEIALGAWQMAATEDGSSPDGNGDVSVYRKALWSAHLGGYDDLICNPDSSECLKYVRDKSSQFWNLYTAPDAEESECHLLPYPISVTDENGISSLESPFDNFPDTTAPVMGAKSTFLPGKLTT